MLDAALPVRHRPALDAADDAEDTLAAAPTEKAEQKAKPARNIWSQSVAKGIDARG